MADVGIRLEIKHYKLKSWSIVKVEMEMWVQKCAFRDCTVIEQEVLTKIRLSPISIKDF